MPNTTLHFEMIRAELTDIVGEDHISTRESDRLVYSIDWGWKAQMWLDRGERPVPPDYIVHPGSPEEVSEIIKVANAYRLPIVPYGGGSGSQGGTLPIMGGIMLDVKRMNKIVEIDECSLTVTAQAGIIITPLEWALNERGLTLPHHPASRHCATLGGCLAPRGSGTISTKYGKAEEMVLRMQVVLPDGAIIRTPIVPYHGAGPDYMRLFLGSEGTFGVITEATMRIEHIPETRLLRGVLFKDMSSALEAGRRIMTRRLNPFVIRLYDPPSTISRVKEVLGYELEGAYMVLGFDGWEELAAAQEKRALDICGELGAQDLGREPGEKWWNHRYDFYYPPQTLKLPWMYDTIETISTFKHIEQLYYAKKAAVEGNFSEWDAQYIGHFSHWFDWGVMLYDRFIVEHPPEDPREALALHNRIWAAAVRASLENHGMINEHHGIGINLSRYMRAQHGEAWPLLQSLKKAIDPRGVMNPGKLGFDV